MPVLHRVEFLVQLVALVEEIFALVLGGGESRGLGGQFRLEEFDVLRREERK